MRARLARQVLLAMFVGSVVGAQTPQDVDVSFGTLMSVYERGDREVIARTLRTQALFKIFLSSIENAMRANAKSVVDPSKEDPVRAMFWLDAAMAASVVSPGNDVTKMIGLGQLPALTTSSTGRRAAFEVLWHQQSMALLQRIKRPDLQMKYLDALELRYATKFDQLKPDSSLARFALDRAVALEQQCWLAQFPVQQQPVGNPRLGDRAYALTDTTRLTTVSSPKEASSLPRTCRDVVTRFDAVAALNAARNEASVRGAVARFRIGKWDEALAYLKRVGATGDRILDYWTALVEGRVAQQLDNLADAEAAYRHAWTIWPDARAPGTGLALVLLDLNQREAAAETSEIVYHLPANAPDPWWAYYRADTRFLTEWRLQLFELAR